MGIQYTGISVLVIAIFILAISPVSGSRNIHRITIERRNQRFQPQHNSIHPLHTPAAAAAAGPKESRNDKVDPIMGVSQRVIPRGPNPLHN
ncbi:hypothetical protein QVD17_01989 [Tagetes erecta]|uniref:Uncharacterized protein n=1 Tax=Tagetes erecta TaxID=13708 RepID=A0AAD8LBR8_TARER|nr:hypothetical protein QVD17_01989 [Tagetes erecta]